jgi:formylglycine-generating enzyme required for sulfatase activity
MAHPLYWQRDEAGRWHEFTLQGLAPLDLARPVTSLSLYEADAYANWAGARLPTEFEWELAERLGKTLRQMFGHCWQWTSSSYAAYPGYAPAPGALGEYNGKFMLNQYVLRGSSSATPPGHARATYRNFFPAGARWQFTGVRLARCASASLVIHLE